MNTDSPQSRYQVVIIGGGMVGASFALALEKSLPATTAAAVLVVEAVTPSKTITGQPGFDARSTALSYGSRIILERTGLWSKLAGFAEPIKRIHVSDRGHFGSTSLDSAQMQVEALGYVLENQRLGGVFNAALEQSARIELLRPAIISSLRPLADGMEVSLQRGAVQQTIRADLVVLADGGKSPLCRQLGIGVREEDYRQQAIISNIALENHHDNIAYERFTDSGPMAVLPLPQHEGEHRAALVWTVSAKDAEELEGLSESQILERLQLRFGYRLGRFAHIGRRYVYPLSLIVAQEQIRPGLVLLGNVAHTLHPVAGQGFNLALRDAEVLA
ncbi:MAG: FAD-dependent monooxygenase, partial [Pseudohongiellaceae bacterium]